MTSHYWTAIDAADMNAIILSFPSLFFRHPHLFIFSFSFLFSRFYSFILSVFCVWNCVASTVFFPPAFSCGRKCGAHRHLGLWGYVDTFTGHELTRNDTIATVLSLFHFHCFHCGWQLRCFFCSTFVYHKDCFALTTWRLLMCSVSFSFIPPSNVFFPSFLFRRFFSSFWRLFCFFCLPLFLLFCRDDIIHWWYRWHPKHQMRNTVDHFDVFLDDASNRSQCQRIALVGRLAYFQRLCHFFSLNHFPIFFRRLHCKRT